MVERDADFVSHCTGEKIAVSTARCVHAATVECAIREIATAPRRACKEMDMFVGWSTVMCELLAVWCSGESAGKGGWKTNMVGFTASTEVCAIDCFFFQAEDGIRYLTVTGVQTCALPI